MSWYYIVDGTSRGPVPEAEIAALYHKGSLSPETLVWTEGMAEWSPLQESALALAAVKPGPGVAQQVCAECGKTFPESEMIRYEQSWVCAACKPVFIQRMMEGAAPKGVLTYAGVGKRFVALIVDGLIVVALLFIIALLPFVALGTLVIGPNHQTLAQEPWFLVLFTLFCYGLGPAFEIFFVGKYGATPGKMLLGIKVVTPEGGRISYARSAGRYFGKILSGLILYIGYLMAFWDPERRALHDMLCGSRVIEKPR